MSERCVYAFKMSSRVSDRFIGSIQNRVEQGEDHRAARELLRDFTQDSK